MTTLPTRGMWWAELAVFLAGTTVTLMLVMFGLSQATGHRSVSLGVGPSSVLLAVSIGVGIFLSGRLRAWGLRRQAAFNATRS
ncbi:hypothetical protein [Actinacidiphila acidipaludis]|uniref:Uncharacterized protein n=1 Tax=Actinacidiphila acidipaludis TaxID=2873382 RepID=A0ABS7QDV8_9ACTN|nr:hypothetical protein [Streptomyces acidipaludis]MBY8879944.1 hypothetical protein [Streptomyces acidipaludis]